ncbi:cytochrome-c peroxidase [Burkholderia sp. RF4-BP95]|uniref:cytochrome-c peroxidase n=1 Tax=Burkholderia sp. RF4-BP95 TaxID=1637845 RepID=UPI000A768FC2|nr:cytochrome c peroxidase [Burkholderia sp. RF4-BP95]
MSSRRRYLLAIACLICWGTGSYTAVQSGEKEDRLSMDERRAVLSLFSKRAERGDETNHVATNPTAIRLGETLFFEKRISASGSVSCSTCHQKELEWSDGLPKSLGEGPGSRRTPSLWNVGNRRWYFWDGRAATLWSQALVPLESPTEIAGNRSSIVELIGSDPKLRELYEAVFGKIDRPDGCHSSAGSTYASDACRPTDLAFANVGKAIAAFETTLQARDAPFDRFLDCLRDRRGQCAQVSAQAQAGLKLFIGKARCVNCHHGLDLTDEEFHDVLLRDSHAQRGDDPGRLGAIAFLRSNPFGPSGQFSDCPSGPTGKLVQQLNENPDLFRTFKTPSLRDVANRAPYMHNGSYRTLRDVVSHYSTLADASIPDHHFDALLTPLNLSGRDIDNLIAFLCTLSSDTGKINGETVLLKHVGQADQCK